MKKPLALLLIFALLFALTPAALADDGAGEARRSLDAARAALTAASSFKDRYTVTAVYSPEEGYDVSLVDGTLFEYRGRIRYDGMFAGKVSYALITDTEGKILAIVTYTDGRLAWLSCSVYDAAAAMAAMRTAVALGGLVNEVEGEIDAMMRDIS